MKFIASSIDDLALTNRQHIMRKQLQDIEMLYFRTARRYSNGQNETAWITCALPYNKRTWFLIGENFLRDDLR